MSVDIKKLRMSNRPAGRRYGGTAAAMILLTVLGVFMIFPIYLTVVMAIKPVEELFVFPPNLYVLRPTLDNFRDMFNAVKQNRVPFSRYVFNSIFVTAAVTASQCILASMAAFVLAKYRFPGSRVINGIVVTSLLYQSSVIYIMQYMVMAKLHIIDTQLALILPTAVTPLGVFLMRQSISQMPDSILDAAKVDGAGIFRIFWQIVIPNQKPALMTLMIIAFQGAWNLQGNGLIFREQYKTLPAAVAQVSSSGMARAGVAMAASVFMLVPPVIVFILAQRHVIETMAHSGIRD